MWWYSIALVHPLYICPGGLGQCLVSRTWLSESGLLCLGPASQTPQEKSSCYSLGSLRHWWASSRPDGPDLFSWTLGSPYWVLAQKWALGALPGQSSLMPRQSPETAQVGVSQLLVSDKWAFPCPRGLGAGSGGLLVFTRQQLPFASAGLGVTAQAWDMSLSPTETQDVLPQACLGLGQ